MAKDGLTDPRLGKRIIAAARLRRYELRVERAIKKVLAQHKAHAMATLRHQHLTAAAPPDAFNLVTWDTGVDDDVLPVIGETLGDIATSATEFLKLPPETRAEILGKLDLSARSEDFANRVRTIGSDVAEKVTDELNIGINKGESIDQLTGRITQAFDFADTLAERVARTETHGVAEATTNDSAQAIAGAGYDVTKEWIATEDSRTRPDHDEADGQVVPIDQPFTVGGEDLMYPGDPDGSAEQVINCRCSVVYDMPTDPDTPDE